MNDEREHLADDTVDPAAETPIPAAEPADESVAEIAAESLAEVEADAPAEIDAESNPIEAIAASLGEDAADESAEEAVTAIEAEPGAEDEAGESEGDAAAEPPPADAVAIPDETQPESVPEPPVEIPPVPATAVEPEAMPASTAVRVWPSFVVYLVAWVALVGSTVWFLLDAAREQAIVIAPLYPYFLFGAVGLAACGPLLALVVWAVARRRIDVSHRSGLLTKCLAWGLVSASAGVALWLAGLYALDLVAAGRIG